MIKKGLLTLVWFPLAFAVLISNLAMLMAFERHEMVAQPVSAMAPVSAPFQLTAVSGTSQVLSAHIEAGDSRVLLIESFLRKHKSPMAPYADFIVSEADRLGLDFRLVPSIAMCESGAGKRMPKKDEYNFAGIAVYTGQNFGKTFTSWPHAITWVSEYIKRRYYDQGLTDLYDIGARWAPPSVNTGYSWSNCVLHFQESII